MKEIIWDRSSVFINIQRTKRLCYLVPYKLQILALLVCCICDYEVQLVASLKSQMFPFRIIGHIHVISITSTLIVFMYKMTGTCKAIPAIRTGREKTEANMRYL